MSLCKLLAHQRNISQVIYSDSTTLKKENQQHKVSALLSPREEGQFLILILLKNNALFVNDIFSGSFVINKKDIAYTKSPNKFGLKDGILNVDLKSFIKLMQKHSE